MVENNQLERVLTAQILTVLMGAYGEASQAADTTLCRLIERFPVRLRPTEEQGSYRVCLTDPRLSHWELPNQSIRLNQAHVEALPQILQRVQNGFRALLEAHGVRPTTG